nr:hypothetical protein CFP56_74084 [Quercus suber]
MDPFIIDPPSTLDCRSHYEELILRGPMVDDRVLTIVRLLGLKELHLLDHVLRQFGLKLEQPREANTNHDLHKIDARGKVEKNWLVEHAVHIQKWNDCDEYVCNALKMEKLATQLAILNWFNEESYKYKFIKKALEDVDEVDHIDVPANDEVANQTKIPHVGPSTSLATLVTLHRLAPTPPLAHETPVPPVSTLQDTTEPPCHPSLPLTLDLLCSLPMLNLSPPYTPPLLTTTHPWPHPIAPPNNYTNP